jgi:hypothetical protein
MPASLKISFLFITRLCLFFIRIKITTAGINNILNIALPSIVAKLLLKPETSCNIIKKKNAVKNSGNELPIALIVAPLTPLVNL